MTDQAFELLYQLEIQAERISSLCVLLEALDTTAPFALYGDKDRQKEDTLYASRFYMGICDLARYYSEDIFKTIASVHM